MCSKKVPITFHGGVHICLGLGHESLSLHREVAFLPFSRPGISRE